MMKHRTQMKTNHQLVLQTQFTPQLIKPIHQLICSSFSESAHSSEFVYLKPEQNLITQLRCCNKELKSIIEDFQYLEEDMSNIQDNVKTLCSNQVFIEKTSARKMVVQHKVAILPTLVV